MIERESDASHHVLAVDDEHVAACKRKLAGTLKGSCAEFRVGIHPTEEKSLPDRVTSLGALSNRTIPDDGLTWRMGMLPEDSAALDAILDAMGEDGVLPVTRLELHGPAFSCAITASTSHQHVGGFDVEETTSSSDSASPNRVKELNEALDRVGIVVPAGTVATWKQDDRYVELTGTHLCIYDESVAGLDREARLSVSHHCHELTGLEVIAVDVEANELSLTWRSNESLTARAAQLVFGPPPLTLTVPTNLFGVVREHLSKFEAEPDGDRSPDDD